MIETKVTDEKKEIKQSLEKVVKGTGFVFFGNIISMFLWLVTSIIITRVWSYEYFGIVSLLTVIINVSAVLSSLGLRQGVTRSIAISRGKKEYQKIVSYISTSIILVLITSFIIAVFLFIFSEQIALTIFNESALIIPLRISSFGLPFLVLIDIIVSIYLGFDDTRPIVYYRSLVMMGLFTIFLLIILLFDLEFISVFYAYVLSMALAFTLLIIRSTKGISYKKLIKRERLKTPEAKQLLIFSLPLLGTAMLQFIITWTDTIMLGIIKTTAEVGLYNLSHSLATLVSFPLGALITIYLPILSGLYAKRKFTEIKRIFAIITKWICSITLPLFIFIFLFSETVLYHLFGIVNSQMAVIALRILSLAFIINNFVGPCGSTLVAMGYSRFIMFSTLSTAILNIILNLFLIPFFSIIGAALASSISIISINLIKFSKLYKVSGAQPISKNLAKPTLIFILLVIPALLFLQQGQILNGPITIGILFLFYIIYFGIIIVSKSIDKEDIDLLMTVEKKMGKNIRRIRKFLSKFV
ncbi:MAG: oligosaccharide flippase family protein [Thermoplasmatales archaeon]|nr:MAG: oligosaccharide flippase family protein [Thermoplasmatales archaeon]